MRALSADAALLQAPRQQRLQGCVHSVFDRVVNVVDGDGALFTLACHDLDDAPDTIVLDTRSFLGLGVAPGDRVRAGTGAILLASGIEIRLDGARAWHAALPAFPTDTALLRVHLQTARRLAGARAFGGEGSTLPSCTPALLARHTGLLTAALARGDLGSAARHGIALLGLGPGLTPSGDDYLVGLFAVLHMPGNPCAALAPVCDSILAEVQDRTHPISAAALKAAARGRVRESLAALLRALVRGPRERVAGALRSVLDIGSSSGADMAAGLLDGLELALGGAPRRPGYNPRMQAPMGQEGLWALDAAAMARRYRDGTLTPRAVAESCLARLDAVNPLINAVVARRDERFLQEADAATERHARGRPLSALDGIPLTVKDSLLTCDLPTTWGTPALRSYGTGQDELAVARVRAAGALIVGKTSVPEFALEGYTANPLFGITRNPWDLRRTPGGSSGGAAAALAAGVAPLAIGQDGGGSIRRPASHTQTVGLKPTLGMVARDHALPSLLLDFEVIGPLARTVGDARTLFDILRGPSPADRHSLAAAQAAHAPRRGPLRLLYVERMGDAPLDAQVAASVADGVRALADLGHEVDAGPLPLDLGFFADAWPHIGQVGLARLFDAHPAWEAAASQKYREMAERGRRLPAARLWQILEAVARLRRETAACFEQVDAVVMPAAAALAWDAQLPYPDCIDGHAAGPRGHAVYTGWVNAAGLPALAVPCAPSREGLPIGMQLVGRFGADDALLALGAEYETARPWAGLWPPLDPSP